MANVRTMRNIIKAMGCGEKIYMNTISMSIAMIEQIRTYIQEGVLAPDEEELDGFIVEEAKEAFRSGESICPQMTYVKLTY